MNASRDAAYPSGALTFETVRFLYGSEGRALLAEAACLPADLLTRLSRLRQRYPAAMASAAVELLELRRRARGKFARAEELFFTPEGLEQSTGDVIAHYRASRFPQGAAVLDACCGVGGDAMALAERGPVLAVDRNAARVSCASANLRAVGARYPARFLCADVTALDLARLRKRGVEAVFFDPSRRVDTATGGRRRVRTGDQYVPPLAWVDALRTHFAFIGVKVSPAGDDRMLQQLEGQVEFISQNGECKEAVVWLGQGEAEARRIDAERSQPGAYSATVLSRCGAPQTLHSDGSDLAPLAPPREWLYEPDPAVIRAHLVLQVAAQIGGALLDPQIAYLTADRYVPTPFATAYRILESLPFNLKQIQAWLRRHGRRVEVVKRRGVPLEPEEIRRKLAGSIPPESAPIVLILTRIAGKPTAILCEPSV